MMREPLRAGRGPDTPTPRPYFITLAHFPSPFHAWQRGRASLRAAPPPARLRPASHRGR